MRSSDTPTLSVARRAQNRDHQAKFVRTVKGIYKTLSRNSVVRGLDVDITRDEFILWYESQDKICVYCGIPEELIKAVPLFRVIRAHKSRAPRACDRLTIDRRNNAMGYQKGNLVLACFRCNSTKSDFFSHEEMLKIGSVIRSKWYE